MMKKSVIYKFTCFTIAVIAMLTTPVQAKENWILIDNFESPTLQGWTSKDTRNNTNPHVENPQVTEVRAELAKPVPKGLNRTLEVTNHYLIKKPAAEGVVGNRKALTFKKLPLPVEVGETSTFFTRFQVEYFPNNHVFGLSNLGPKGIAQNDYNAFEPSIRITDKAESNGYKNDGTLMVKKGKGYDKIHTADPSVSASPLEVGVWYDVWYVVNNATKADGGQSYDLYVKGGEFAEQTPVYSHADFRMKREQPLIYFLMNCNTGPVDKPYGNGGILYDDIYMIKGKSLSSPIN